MSTRPTELTLPHGNIPLPAFLPDATQGVVRTLDAVDVAACQVSAVMMNVFHLMQRPGSNVIKELGGLHKLFGWARPIITDSGGFQAYSLIHQNPKLGSLSDQGILFRPEGSERKLQLSPEKSIQLQMRYDADIVICLDDCTHVQDSISAQREAVRRTIKWAKRGKEEYLRILGERKHADDPAPRIFAVIQGGGERDLRRECAEGLLALGFDGFGFGGWPLDAQGSLLADIIGYTRELVPPQFLMHALGVGHPQHVVTCYALGYDLCDSAMPTRDARHGRLLTFTSADADPRRAADKWFRYLYIQDERQVRDESPLSMFCDGLCCRHYSRAYLHHLFKIGDSLFYRLATIHNLRFMTQLMARLQRRVTLDVEAV
jgi:queuine tRNA-ribosyltransferase